MDYADAVIEAQRTALDPRYFHLPSPDAEVTISDLSALCELGIRYWVNLNRKL